MVSSMNEKAKLFIPGKKRRFFIAQMLNKKMQKEVTGVIAADKELTGEHG